MRLSEVDLTYVKEQCGVADDDLDSNRLLSAALEGGRSYILSATGLARCEADEYDDLSVALLTIVYDAFYNRSYRTEAGSSNGVNPLVEQIIEQHRRNFL